MMLPTDGKLRAMEDNAKIIISEARIQASVCSLRNNDSAHCSRKKKKKTHTNIRRKVIKSILIKDES